MSLMPIRVQLSRRKGWKMPPNSVKVDRSTRWGNPYTALKWGEAAATMFDNDLRIFGVIAARVTGQGTMHTTVDDIRRELRGKNLACWCALNASCHADVLLRIANE